MALVLRAHEGDFRNLGRDHGLGAGVASARQPLTIRPGGWPHARTPKPAPKWFICALPEILLLESVTSAYSAI